MTVKPDGNEAIFKGRNNQQRALHYIVCDGGDSEDAEHNRCDTRGCVISSNNFISGHHFSRINNTRNRKQW